MPRIKIAGGASRSFRPVFGQNVERNANGNPSGEHFDASVIEPCFRSRNFSFPAKFQLSSVPGRRPCVFRHWEAKKRGVGTIED